MPEQKEISSENKPNIKWDLLRVIEPNGIDKIKDQEASNEIMRAMSEGFEPFAVVPSMTVTPFSPKPVVINQIYFRRPSVTEELLDNSDRIIK